MLIRVRGYRQGRAHMRGLAFTLTLLVVSAHAVPVCAGFAGVYAPEHWTFHSDGPAWERPGGR